MSMNDRGHMSRRSLLRQSLLAGLWATGVPQSKQQLFELLAGERPHSQRSGSFVGIVPFSGEGGPPMGKAIGAELDGRLFTDLSALTPENLVVPTESFFIRTRASKLLSTGAWSVQVGGLVHKPITISADEFVKRSRAMGTHVMECSGNTRTAHFGLLSSAEWEGVPLQEILERTKTQTPGARVLVSGFDRYEEESMSSTPGASWIFTQEQMYSSNAFLATKMNGQALNADHGAPVRLFVPGWYGCVCIKWVNQIDFVSEDVTATSQMREYAGRTLQTGVPVLARDYQPATMGAAAMPVRIEKWRVGEKIQYRVAGIRWGGSGASRGIEARFGDREEFVPVETVAPRTGGCWDFWSHDWTPARRGEFTIRLRLKGEANTRKLDSGYYDRSVTIDEI